MSRSAILTALGVGAFATGIVSMWWTELDHAPLGQATADAGRAPGAAAPLPPKPLWNAGSPTASPGVATPKPVDSKGFRPTAQKPVPEGPVAQLTREELEFRALKVEQQANHELKNLLSVLDLTEAQQDRAFSILAQRSSYYHPDLQVQTQDAPGGSAPAVSGSPALGGSTVAGGGSGGNFTAPSTATPSASSGASGSGDATTPITDVVSNDTSADPLDAVLTDEQKQAYERYKDERVSFWSGIVERIEAQMPK